METKNVYEPCEALARCNELIERYWNTGDYEGCFQGHLALAETGYPLAECQVGYFYLQGIGTAQDAAKGLYWTKRAALHGDRDAQNNLAECYEQGLGTARDPDRARHWYLAAAASGSPEAQEKCRAAGWA